MSQTPTNQPESQKERWIKYGANVALSSFVVIVLAVLLTWMAQRHPRRIDTTIGGAQSLRPQTLNFIKDLKQKVRIIALYPKLKSDSREQDYYQPVADMLNDYASKGQNITVELIDPDTDKDRFKKLVEEVTNKYGGEVKSYKAILDALPTQSEIISKYALAESTKCHQLITPTEDENLRQELDAEQLTLQLVAAKLSELKDDVASELAQQVPSYKDAVDETSSTFTFVSQALAELSALFDHLKSDASVPKTVQDYLPDAQARTAAVAKTANALLERIHHLGALTELDEFREQLKSKSILVMTDAGYKILQFNQLWNIPEATRLGLPGPETGRLVFVGEQQISKSIASLTMANKPMVVFVRPQGGPLAGTTMQGEPGPFAAVAQRLREYNFDVQEKDASGQAAMQQQEMQAPEPTDEQMKTAIWVVLRFPGDSQTGPSPINAMLAKHLAEGGSAMVMLLPNADSMSDVLAPWGISAKTDFMVLHESIVNTENRAGDQLNQAIQAIPILFMLNRYGDHPLTAPLAGLNFLIQLTAPVTAQSFSPGITATPLLPIPQTPHSWATSDSEAKSKILQGQLATKVQYYPNADPDNGRPAPDIDNTAGAPLYGAAAAEKTNGGRLVVVGSFYFATNYLIDLKDSDRPDASKLPGNGEFFVDSIFWLAHMDSMLAISPHALEVARVADLSAAKLAFWRVGILTAGLPAAVVVAGLMVYYRRRD